MSCGHGLQMRSTAKHRMCLIAPGVEKGLHLLAFVM